MGDYYAQLQEIAEASEAYYDQGQDRYEPSEDDLNDWFSGSPWQEPDDDHPF